MSLAVRLQLAFSGFSLDVDLDLPGRGVTALFGPSGSGKTTCLRAIAGLEQKSARQCRCQQSYGNGNNEVSSRDDLREYRPHRF